MKKETLEKANKIAAEIKSCKEHKYEMESALKKGIKDLMARLFGDSYDRHLREEVLPIPLDNFIAMYMLNLDKRIAELEKELENLKD